MARLQQKKQAAVTTGSAKSSGLPCAMVLRLLRALPGDHCLVATVVRERFRGLSACFGAPGPHDFAVRVSIVRPRDMHALDATRVHRIPHPRFVTIGRNAPLHRGGTVRMMLVIWGKRQQPGPATDWHDGQFSHGGCADSARLATGCFGNDRSLNRWIGDRGSAAKILAVCGQRPDRASPLKALRTVSVGGFGDA